MQAVILAAGYSKRMGAKTQDKPKCLIEIKGQTILSRMLKKLISVGVDELVMTVGYRHTMIRDFIKENFPDLKVEYLLNNDYENNNNAYSLWMTREKTSGPIFLLDSDIVFDVHILEKLLANPEENCLAVRTADVIGEEEMKVSLQEGTRKISDISKQIDIRKAYGESIGIERFNQEMLDKLYRTLQKRVIDEDRINEFYEASFKELIDIGEEIYAVDIGPMKAAELDFPEDIEDAEKKILPFI